MFMDWATTPVSSTIMLIVRKSDIGNELNEFLHLVERLNGRPKLQQVSSTLATAVEACAGSRSEDEITLWLGKVSLLDV